MQLLNIDPQNELKFKVEVSGLYEQAHTTYMRLQNTSATDTVLFKIKTTAPKKYCVRPNSGAVEPNSKVDIAITPQFAFVDPNEKHKHKFMVQTAIAPEGSKTNIDRVWKDLSQDQIQDQKLKCVFEAPPAFNLNDSGDAAQNELTKKRVAAADEAKPTTKDTVEGFLQNEAKSDKDGDYATANVNAKMNLTTINQKSDNVENDLHKATTEVILLRDEGSKLRQENLQLKEELLRLRQVAGELRGSRRHSYGEKTQQVNYMSWVATAVGMALLGIIIGKFFV